MTVFEALPTDIGTALYHYCKDDECLNDAVLRALRNELKIDQVEHDKYSHDCLRCDKFKKGIVNFKQEKRELLGIIQVKDNVIKDLEWQLQEVAKDNDNYQAENKELENENAELKKRNGELAGQKASLERWFGEAKSIIREYVDYPTSNDELWKLHEKAEQFLSEVKE